VALRAMLDPYLTGAQFITFFPAVVLAAYLCGPRAGLFAAVLCGAGAWYLFLTPLMSFRFEDTASAATLLGYFLTACAIAVLVGGARVATETARVSNEALRASEEQFRTLADSSPALIWVTDVHAQVTFANRRYEEVFGKPADAIEGEGWRSIVHPEDVDEFNAKFLAALTARARFTGEVRVQDRDGEIMWLHCEGVPRFTADGTFLGYVGANLDITAAKRAEAQLRALNDNLERRIADAVAQRQEANALYRAYFENTPEALFIIGVPEDGVFVIEEINPAHEAGVGMKLADVAGKRVDEILPEPLASRVLETYQHVVETGAMYQYREIFELNGIAGHWDTALVPLRDADGRITRLIGSSRNVTRQVEAEEALRQAQKMEAIGQLTGGVAHDFNNLLTPIIGSLDRLQRKGLADERDLRLVDGAMQSAERARTLVQRLLAFARRQPLQTQAVDLDKLLHGLRDLLESTLGPRIGLSFEVAQGLPAAATDRNQMEMAILNLAVNARDAMPDGGKLKMAASLAPMADGNEQSLVPGDYIRLQVTDTGTGMDEATLARAVEPFFSTKGIGRGTGLGLSMVHGLAAQLGGALCISSEVACGTTIDLYLPVSEQAPGIADAATMTGPHRAHGTILLVDDEALIRMSTADLLDDLGYDVIEAGSGEEALRLTSDGAAFDILITDQLMAGMSGTDLIAAMRASRPGLQALIISGYADLEGVASDIPRLVKPFRLDELAAKLDGLTAARSTATDRSLEA
jgi:PAS domain S-box-containing protein